jgi:hypothetical protein
MNELEAQVLELLSGGPQTRLELIEAIYGLHLERGELANSRADRRIRLAIAGLRRRGVLVVSTSDQRGYRLAESQEEVKAYVREQVARIRALHRNVSDVQRAYGLQGQYKLPEG